MGPGSFNKNPELVAALAARSTRPNMLDTTSMVALAVGSTILFAGVCLTSLALDPCAWFPATAQSLAGVSYLVTMRSRRIKLSDGFGPSLG